MRAEATIELIFLNVQLISGFKNYHSSELGFAAHSCLSLISYSNLFFSVNKAFTGILRTIILHQCFCLEIEMTIFTGS